MNEKGEFTMSQAKVDQYKEAKKNRKEIAKKAKRKSAAMKLGAFVILAAIVVWIGYSAVVTVQNAEGPAVSVDTTAITDYVNGL